MILKKGFTLSEVLITLTVLGVVAVIVVPSIIKRVSDKQIATSVKRTYSVLHTALDASIVENGEIWSWFSSTDTDVQKGEKFADILMSKIHYVKVCGVGDTTCFPNGKITVKKLTGEDYGAMGWGGENHNFFRTYVLKNGVYVGFRSINTNDVNAIAIDVNGAKEPNRMGFDTFYFWYDKNGFYLKQGYMSTGQEYCNMKNPGSGWTNGYTCSVWVIKKGNLNYKYRDVSTEW